MNNWNRVEKKTKPTTDGDIQWLYIKAGIWVVSGLLFTYFIVMGWHL